MKKSNTKWLIVGLIGVAAVGFYFWNRARINDLKTRLALLQASPPASSNPNSWKEVIKLLLDLGMDVYSAFSKGGAFYKKNNNFTGDDLDSIIKDIA